ncbi:MAG: DUF4097 family beta strand repeat-containing protein [Salinibacter sp.]
MPRTSHLRLGALLGAALLLLVAPVADAQTTRTVTRSFSLARTGHVALDTFTGSINVTGGNRSRVTVKARIEGDDPELVEKTRLRFNDGDDRLSVEVDYDEVKDSQEFLGLFNIGNVDRPAAHLTIKMPRGAALTVDDFSSEISVTDLHADITLDTFSSPITLRNVEGAMDLKTFSGEIEGERLRGRVQLETFSGEVQLRMTALTGDSQLETFSGDIELALPADAGFELVGEDDAFGELESEFALRAEDGRRIAGGGGPGIEIETFSGTIQLRKQ